MSVAEALVLRTYAVRARILAITLDLQVMLVRKSGRIRPRNAIAGFIK
jgi:hypothetical protein